MVSYIGWTDNPTEIIVLVNFGNFENPQKKGFVLKAVGKEKD